ncbi:MAG: cyclase family protein [Candidatus Gracilibacteria bacterium]|jgi:kynurenine formamidase
MQNSSPFIDLTRLTTSGMPVYPGDESPELLQTLDFEEYHCVNHSIKSSMHVGTHMDGPMHMVKEGRRLCDIEVERFFGRGLLVDARGKNLLDTDLLPADIHAGDIVLFWTDWGSHFGQPVYFENFPVLTEALAQRLVELKVKMVGLDTPSPDHEPYAVHRILLKEEILIVENLTGLAALDGKSFEVTALPTKYAADSAPARVIARLV